MKILFVVQPLEDDPVDANHVRVEHHPAEGLTYTDCMVDGVARYVYSTSRIQKGHPVTKSRTILVHLKPLPEVKAHVAHCRDIDTRRILKKVRDTNWWPTTQEYVFWNERINTTSIARLVKRKQQKLVRKGYVRLEQGVPFITEKGLVHAGN